MAFRVEISPEAFEDLDAIAAYITLRHWARKPISDDELQELLDDSAGQESE